MTRFVSLRWRLVASYVLLTGITVGVIVLLATTLLRQYMERQEIEALQANADAIAQQAQPLINAGRMMELERLTRTAAFLSNTRVNILNKDKKSVVDSGRPPTDQVIMLVTPGVNLNAENPMQFLSFQVFDEAMQRDIDLQQLPAGSKFMTVRRVTTPFGNRLFFEEVLDPATMRFSAATLPPDNGVLRAVDVAMQQTDADAVLGYVRVSSTRDSNTDPLRPIVQNLAIAGSVAAVLAALVGWVVSSGLTRPVQRLTLTASRISQGDLSARTQLAPAQQPRDEIGQLAGQFDQMATRLQASFGELAAERDALRRFIADASHELRTPITALKMYNELLQGQANDNPDTRHEFLTATQQQLTRLEWITQNLLDLSRLDAGLIKLNLADTSALGILQQAAAPFAALAQQKQVTVSITAAPQLLVRCDSARMQMVLGNLIDNAVKFTPAGGQVRLLAERGADGIVIHVRDTGPGIPEADLPHIFDRFYRGQNEALAAGNGLGLSIVRSIVQAHGGQVEVASTPGQGTCVTVRMP